MRQILVDHARQRRALKRGGGEIPVPLDESKVPGVANDRVLEIHEALEELEAIDSRQSEIVVMKHFGGMQNKEIASVLGISESTVKRDWLVARAWLYGRISGDART